MWNSVGIAESIERFVQAQDLMNLDREHVEILAGCLVQQPQPEDRDTWFRIYENLKSYIFVGLCDRDLCNICGEILKKFLTFEAVQDSIMEVFVSILCPKLYCILYFRIQEPYSPEL